MKYALLIFALCGFLPIVFLPVAAAREPAEIAFGEHDLVSDSLARSWDEAIPLGNGVVGSLVWQNNANLRLSLDRADLWDLRPMENLNAPNFKFRWVYEQWKNDNYCAVQAAFDAPYDQLPAPSKIPGAALEFDVRSFGKVTSARLSIKNAICKIEWDSGTQFTSFVHPTEPVGWFRFRGMKEKLIDGDFSPQLVPPPYNTRGKDEIASSLTGQDLRRLGYPPGNVALQGDNTITYTQAGWGGFEYEVTVSWHRQDDRIDGCWSIRSSFAANEEATSTNELVQQQLAQGYDQSFLEHRQWWDRYWAKSSVDIPDPILEKQYYLEMYKFGSAARDAVAPISLQAVWTADNGKLPPWKGDFHHDLNTQLSYWPAYSGNHLDLEIGFLNWLQRYKPTFTKYTRDYFEVDGLAVPGVTTLTGQPMGGWIQYSLGPTVSAWLAHHFYLHWRYSMDREFLEEQAYPWIHDVALFLDAISVKDAKGQRKLPISSTPELHNNSRQAWFSETTNFDLALIRWTYEKAAELATELGKDQDARKWLTILSEWPELTVDPQTGLVFAPGTPYTSSHRHFSHLVGFHPLGIVDRSHGEAQQQVIDKTLANLLAVGSDAFCGYSFSWLGSLQARDFDGEGAAKSLRIFAENFVLPNSFHANGEQHNRGYSDFKYRPFTLEGNFAFAAAIQEMLIQSHTGVVQLFPAIPASWRKVGFEQLRTEGAFLVSAIKSDGLVRSVKIVSEKGGVLKLRNPFEDDSLEIDTDYTLEDDVLVIPTAANQVVLIKTHDTIDAALPEATPQHLPTWHGFNLLEKFYNNGNNPPFVETDFQYIHELGFNFVRLPMDYRVWIKNGDWNQFNEQQLEQIDQAIQWGKKYSIHVNINFHRAPGYTVASPPEPSDLWTDAETQQVCAKHWAVFAKRYKGIPNSQLSFNLFNEPASVSKVVYLNVVRIMAEAIRAEDPSRLIISDGLEWGNEPLPELAKLNIAMATRGYNPFQLTHYKASWADGSDRFPEPTWPRYLAYGNLVAPEKQDMSPESRKPLTITGSFDKPTKLRIHLDLVSSSATLVAKADAVVFWEKSFVCGPGKGEWKEASYFPQWDTYQNVYDRDYLAIIPAGTQRVELSVSEGDWLSISEIGLEGGGGQEDKLSLENSWDKEPAQISYAPNAASNRLTTPAAEDRQWLWDTTIRPWLAVRDQGVGVIVGEFGAYNRTSHGVTLAWLEDCLANWKRAEFGWAMWNFRGPFGILDSERSDVEYEDFHGHKLDRKMLDLLQAAASP